MTKFNANGICVCCIPNADKARSIPVKNPLKSTIWTATAATYFTIASLSKTRSMSLSSEAAVVANDAVVERTVFFGRERKVGTLALVATTPTTGTGTVRRCC